MTRRRSNYDSSCWKNRSSLELALIGIVLTVGIFCIALVVLVTVKIPSITPQSCTTPICTDETTQITQSIDTAVNPCDNFYQFSCGNLLKNAHGDEKLGALLSLQESVERQLIELYSEPISANDHEMVNFAKQLFRACMDEDEIDRDGLKSIKEVLRMLGGWPVVEGPGWDENKFDWLQASFRLRELGYRFSVFLDLLVTSDPIDNNKFMFEVSIPVEHQFLDSRDFRKNEFIVEVAVALGANRNWARKEVAEMIQFAEELQKSNFSSKQTEKFYRRFSVFTYNRFNFNWIEFINNLAYPAARISRDQLVVFPDTNILSKWFSTISKTPKRVQSNYMMWKVIEETIPYLTKKVRRTDNHETRSNFCLKEAQRRFYPNPINVIYARKYFTQQIKQDIGELVGNLKNRFVEIVNNADWINQQDKEDFVEKIKHIAIVTGAPENYMDDEVFDNLKIDMKDANNYNALSLLSQANKKYKTGLFSKVDKTRNDIKLNKWYLGTVLDYSFYDAEDNVLRIPVTIMQSPFFNGNRPNYLNYGRIGTQLGREFVKLLSEEVAALSGDTSAAFRTKIKCMANDLHSLHLEKNSSLPEKALHEALALKMSYDAYQKWTKEKGEEAQLAGTRYTPNQMFWITAVLNKCKPLNSYKMIFQTSEEHHEHSNIVFGSLRNIQEFARDLICPIGSPMNPRNKCHLL